MATFTGQIIVLDWLVARERREREVVRVPQGAISTEPTRRGLLSHAVPPSYAPVVRAGYRAPLFSQPDWPDFRAESRSITSYRNTLVDGQRLKDRFYGLAARPRFTCPNLVPGLAYILSVKLEEGPAGGPFTAYPSLNHIYSALATSAVIDVTLPTPDVGREIRVSDFTNVRYFG